MVDEVVDREARHRVTAHELVCAERYDAITKSLVEVKSQMALQAATLHDRLTVVSNRMWLFVAGVATTATLVILSAAGALLFHLLTRR